MPRKQRSRKWQVKKGSKASESELRPAKSSSSEGCEALVESVQGESAIVNAVAMINMRNLQLNSKVLTAEKELPSIPRTLSTLSLSSLVIDKEIVLVEETSRYSSLQWDLETDNIRHLVSNEDPIEFQGFSVHVEELAVMSSLSDPE